MTADPARLADARRLRDEARATVMADLQELKEQYAPQELAGRARERVSDEVHGMLDQAKDVLAGSKPVIVLTVAALAGWFARHRLLAFWRWMTGAEDAAEPEDRDAWEED